MRLPEPIFEFFLKSDALHDPLCNDDHIRVLGWASAGEIATMKALTHKVNAVLKPMFAQRRHRARRLQARVRPPDRRSGRTDRARRRIHAGWLPALGREDRREDGQGPLPARPRRCDRALSRSGAADRRAVVDSWNSFRALCTLPPSAGSPVAQISSKRATSGLAAPGIVDRERRPRLIDVIAVQVVAIVGDHQRIRCAARFHAGAPYLHRVAVHLEQVGESRARRFE